MIIDHKMKTTITSLDLLQRIALLTSYKHELNFHSAKGRLQTAVSLKPAGKKYYNNLRIVNSK